MPGAGPVPGQDSAGLDAVKGTWGRGQLRVPVATAAAAGTNMLPRKAAPVPGIPTKGTTIHTLVTSNGSPYLNFQNRIMCALAMHPLCCMCSTPHVHVQSGCCHRTGAQGAGSCGMDPRSCMSWQMVV